MIPSVSIYLDALNESLEYELLVEVWDPTDQGFQPRGKQSLHPGGIFYTSTTGIWQTVWLEAVGENYISDYKVYPDLDDSQFNLKINCGQENSEGRVVCDLFEEGKKVGSVEGKAGEMLSIPVAQARIWSPSNPFLYDLNISLLKGNDTIDRVKAYAALRKISLGHNDDGKAILELNNEFVFQNGPLDQGFWPDGIYSPPTEEAMRYDLGMIREIGFNVLRKHVKVESRRYYYWCDKMGMLVWQDMPSGFKDFAENETREAMPEAAKAQFKTELGRMINTHFNHPSILMWIPFNEGWGQFETDTIVDLIRELDPDPARG